MIDERTAVQESQLGEKHGTDEWHRRELLEVDFHWEFVLFLLHHEGHLTEAGAPHFESRSRVLGRVLAANGDWPTHRVYGIRPPLPPRRHYLRPWLRFNDRGWSRPIDTYGRSRDFPESVVRVFPSTITSRFHAPSVPLTMSCTRAGKSFPTFNRGKYRPEEITKPRVPDCPGFFSFSDYAIEIASRTPQALADDRRKRRREGRGKGLCRAISAAGNSLPKEERLTSECDVADDGSVSILRMLHRRRTSFPRSSTSRRDSRGRNAAGAIARHFRNFLELKREFDGLYLYFAYTRTCNMQ